MANRRRNRSRVTRLAAGARAIAAVAALVAALLCFPGLWVLDALLAGLPRTTELYSLGYVGLILYALILAPLVGVVAGVGGRFTHGALVAREYGLPAVVPVAGATERISDCQRVRVDRTNGSVELLEN